MDKSVKNMFKHFTAFTLESNRKFSMLPHVAHVGFLPAKRERVEKTFDSCNFSFILQGTGEYLFRGRRYEVHAPCMLIQWPGEPMSYGADSSWCEMYFIYPEETFAVWKQTGLFTPDDPVRKMYNPAGVIERTLELYHLLQHPPWSGDRIDSLCYDLVLETWLDEQKTIIDSTHIPAIRKRLEESIGREMDCNELAKEFNMSLSSLRRYWRKYHGDETFAEYRNHCFLLQSCRLLAETGLAVKEIAGKMNFADPFYFSRKFTQLAGITPVEYRKKYRR